MIEKSLSHNGSADRQDGHPGKNLRGVMTMNDSNNQYFIIMLMDLVNENLLTMEEAELARRYYLREEKTESNSNGMGHGKVA